MTITCDPAKRAWTLKHRGIDFVTDATKVFAGDRATWFDDRFDYGEVRRITAGRLDGRMVVIVWTQRGANQHVVSMRYCHAREVRKIESRFGL